MKKGSCIFIFVIILLTACSSPAASTTGLKPGDRVGDFLVTTGDGQEYQVSITHCPYDSSTSTESCTFPVGSSLNVACAMLDDDLSDDISLDAIWEGHQYEMTIGDQPVNLDAFGWIETEHPMAGTLRIWDVVLTSDQPGTIPVKGAVEVDGSDYNCNVILTLVEP
jgi:hypothetical protein